MSYMSCIIHMSLYELHEPHELRKLLYQLERDEEARSYERSSS